MTQAIALDAQHDMVTRSLQLVLGDGDHPPAFCTRVDTVTDHVVRYTAGAILVRADPADLSLVGRGRMLGHSAGPDLRELVGQYVRPRFSLLNADLDSH